MDIFLLFQKSFPEEEFKRTIVRIAEEAFGRYTLKYSAHPYARVLQAGYEIDIVPAYRVSSAGELKTPVDRSPLHASFLEERLTPELASEVRLLKAFTRGIGAYGAEVKVGGLSGYLCELLILHYGSFVSAIQTAANWREPALIDIMGTIPSPSEALRLFSSPLIVVDPVDRRRNVASALSKTQFYRFKAACKAFMANPSEDFFFPPEQERPNRTAIKEAIDRRKTYIALIVFSGLTEPPDTLWTQAKSAARKVKRALSDVGFEALFCIGATDEESSVGVLVELDRRRLSSIEVRVGPRVDGPGDVEFVTKHIFAEDTVAGPFVLEDRWATVKERRITDARRYIEGFFDQKQAIGIGLPRKLVEAPEKVILDDKGLLDLPDWAKELVWSLLRKVDSFAGHLARSKGV